MERSELTKQMTSTNIDRMLLMEDKGSDYADSDALSNFKRMAILCKVLDVTPSRSTGDCARFLMLLKIDRWCNLMRTGKPPANESVRDTVLDLHNYIDLAYASDCEPSITNLTSG